MRRIACLTVLATWSAAGSGVGAGDWRLVALLRCESGDDGSAVFVRRSKSIRIR